MPTRKSYRAVPLAGGLPTAFQRGDGTSHRGCCRSSWLVSRGPGRAGAALCSLTYVPAPILVSMNPSPMSRS